MRIIVTGAGGQVGWELVRRAAAGHEVLAPMWPSWIVSNAAAVDAALAASGADVLINAAAYTADKAEQESALAFCGQSRRSSAHLAAACQRLHIPLLHISTDYVYDGSKAGPWLENDARRRWRVRRQQAGRRRSGAPDPAPAFDPWVSWVFGVHGHNFVKTMLRLAREREELRVVADQQGCPTFAGDIADVLLELAGRSAEIDARDAWGIYHYGGAPLTSWHGFASAIVASARARETLPVQRVTAIATTDYPTPARRPLNSVLDCSVCRPFRHQAASVAGRADALLDAGASRPRVAHVR